MVFTQNRYIYQHYIFYVLFHTHIAQSLLRYFPLCLIFWFRCSEKTYTLFWWNFTYLVLKLLIVTCCLWLLQFINNDSILTLIFTLIRAPTVVFNFHFEIEKRIFSLVLNLYSKIEIQKNRFSFFNYIFILKY